MPYVENENIRIHYRVEGDGPALLLNHWSLGSLVGWYDYGYVDSLKKDYTVISLDVRGHGKSDKPHEPAAYALENRVADIVAVLDALGVDRAHYYGYSMGGWIGFGIAKYAPERFRSLAVGGAHPYEQSMSGLRDLIAVGVEQGAEAFVNLLMGMNGKWTQKHKAQWMDADFVAQQAAAQDRSSLQDILPMIECPFLVVAGAEDSVFDNAERACEAIPHGRFVSFSGLDHGGVLARSDLIVPLLREFFGEVEEQTGEHG